jgi:hypothetical protein
MQASPPCFICLQSLHMPPVSPTIAQFRFENRTVPARPRPGTLNSEGQFQRFLPPNAASTGAGNEGADDDANMAEKEAAREGSAEAAAVGLRGSHR